jgi:hypothetical protein
MPTLNRFPLLGLWAEEAARRVGYPTDEAETLGHAYAVLYAIRKNRLERQGEKTEEKHEGRRPARVQQLQFGGDDLDVIRVDGKLCGLVGGARPQTPQTYHASIQKKFPPGYYEKLQHEFRSFFKAYPPRRLDSRLIYNIYDQWKKACAVGRFVDLDKLLAWCHRGM